MHGPRDSYVQYGFVETGEVDAGEHVIRLELCPGRGGSDRERVYISSMKRFVFVLAIAGLFGLILFVAATAQNQGCFPWQEPVTVGGGAFSEGDRGQRFCR